MSPASPEKAISVLLFSSRVLSSVAFRIVGPRIAAFEAATMVKSLPVIPRRTSLVLSVDASQSGSRRLHIVPCFYQWR